MPRAKKTADTAIEPSGSTAQVDGVDADLLTPVDQDALLAQIAPGDLARFYLSNETEGKRFYQRSLDLFGDGVAIGDVREELLLKKVSQRVKFVNPPKLLQRQLHNVLLFVARPNITTQEIFQVPLDYLGWAVEHKVNGFVYLRESISEMQQTLMNISYQGAWTQTQLLQDVVIKDNVLYYKIPALLRRLYGAPERYYHVSMRMNARFRSKYAHALYELLVENLWRKSTGFITVAEFREKMGVLDTEYQEYKRLASRVLNVALKELEELGDYYASVKYKHEARKVVALNFIIHENPKNAAAGEDDNLDPECFKVLREEFGLTSKQITELTRSFEIRRIHDVTDVLFYRYICKNKPVRFGFRLMQNAMADTEDKYFLTNTEKAELQAIKERRHRATRAEEFEQSKISAQQSIAERFDAWWASLGPTEQQTVWDLYMEAPESAPARQARRVKPGSSPDLSSPLAKGGLTNFAARTGQVPERSPDKPAVALATSLEHAPLARPAKARARGAAAA